MPIPATNNDIFLDRPGSVLSPFTVLGRNFRLVLRSPKFGPKVHSTHQNSHQNDIIINFPTTGVKRMKQLNQRNHRFYGFPLCYES